MTGLPQDGDGVSIRSSHVCVEADVSWVEFLNGAVEHNLEKIRSLLRLQ